MLSAKFLTSQNFIPTNNAGLTLWLRSTFQTFLSGTTTPAVDTEDVGTWRDSVTVKNFNRVTAGQRPMLAKLEGYPTVRFGGANRTQQLEFSNKVVAAVSTFCVSVAVRFTQRSTATTYIYSESNSSSSTPLLQIRISSTGLAGFVLRDGSSNLMQGSATPRIDDGQIHIITLRLLSGRVKLFVDGVEKIDQASTLSGWTSSTFNRSNLGARNFGGTVEGWTMCDIYEVVAYTPALNDPTLALHHLYMMGKYKGALPIYEVCGNSWGSDQYSQAIYRNGKTYIGSFNTNLSPQVTVIDHNSSNSRITYSVDNNIGSDRHNAVALNFDSTGRLVAFYDNHNTNVLYFNKSTNVEDASAWGARVDIGPGTAHTYPHVVTTNEGVNSYRIYVFYRDQDHGCWTYRYSDNDGTTWASAQVLWQPQGDISLQIYGRVRKCADGNLHFIFGSDDVDSTTPGSTDLYHWMYKPADGKWYKSDGTTEITSLPFDTADATKAYDSSNNSNRHPSFTGDVLTEGSNIYITIGTFDNNGAGGRRLIRAVYSGSWSVEEITTPGTTPTTSFAPNDPDTIYYLDSLSGTRQIRSAVYNGSTWTLTTLTTASDHFGSTSSGPSRVVDGENVHIVFQWGGFIDSATPYGQLMCYPSL